MISEIGVYFFPNSGHDHDGVNSSLIDTSAYSIFDFEWTTQGSTPFRDFLRETRYTQSFLPAIRQEIQNLLFKDAGIFIQPGSVGGGILIANSVTANEIAANTITANEIASNTITANQIAANTITANQIASNAITADEIAAGTITADEIASGAITADELAANIVLINNVIASNNYVPNVSGWAINGNGFAELANTSIRGTLSAVELQIDANNRWNSNGFVLGGLTGIYTSNGSVRIGTNVIIEGTIVADEIQINNDNFWNSNGFVLGGNTGIYTSNGIVRIGANVVIEGTIIADQIAINNNNFWNDGGFALGGTAGIYTNNGVVRIGTSVIIEGDVVADEIAINNNNRWNANGFVLGGNTGIYTSNGLVRIGTSVIIEGTVAANSVSTPGVDILANGVLAANNFTIFANGQITNGNFAVTASGVLLATGANITGQITASSGFIGSWQIIGGNIVGTGSSNGIPTILDEDGNNQFGNNVDAGGRITAYSPNESALYAVNGGLTTNSTARIRGIGIAFEGSNIIASGNYMGLRWDSPNIYGTVDNVVSAILGTVSDIRFKLDIQDLDDTYVEKILNNVKVVEYTPVDLLNNNKVSSVRNVGIVAQHLLEIIPELVTYDPSNPDAYMSTNYLGFVPHLVKIVQHLNERIEQLENSMINLTHE